ncbi:MAG: hypothetical protein ABL897_03175 [Hyphomicrobium sp.]
MRSTTKFALTAAMAALAATVTALPASAACTRLGFSVNDYGKDGPTKDAKELLDKYIAKKMADRGITKYKTGKKDVTCELYLNLIVFDEHTCKAEATVCWDGAPLPKGEAVTAEGSAKPVAKAPAEKAEVVKPAEQPKAVEEPVKAVEQAAPAAEAEKPATP